APYGQECRDVRESSDDVGTLRLQRGGTVTGRVLDERGAPLPGARVHFGTREDEPGTSPPDPIEQILQAAATDEDGRFELADLPAGQVEADASAPDCLNASWPSFQLAAGEVHPLDPVTLAPGGTLAGVVLDPAGHPVAGAEVSALDLPLQQRAMPQQFEYYARASRMMLPDSSHAVTDAAGRFELRGLAGASHSLIAHAQNFSWTVQHDLPNGATDVALHLGEPAVLDVSVVDHDTHASLAATV